MVALGCALTISTQSARAQHFEFGLRDGVSLSQLIGIDNTFPLAELYVGVVGNYFFNEKWGVGFDLTLAEQGACCMPNSDDVAIDYRYTYLNIPLLGHFQFNLRDNQVLRFSAGMQVGLFLLGQMEYTAPSIFEEGYITGSEWMPAESFHPVDFGVSLGASYVVKKNIGAQIRYNYGFTNVFKNVDNVANQTIEIGAFYLF